MPALQPNELVARNMIFESSQQVMDFLLPILILSNYFIKQFIFPGQLQWLLTCFYK